MSVDLLKNQQRWKDTLSETRKVINEVQGREAKDNPASVRPWRAHWNRQLYKGLEHQYQMGLEALNHNLPEIKVDLVFRYEVFSSYSYKVFDAFYCFID